MPERGGEREHASMSMLKVVGEGQREREADIPLSTDPHVVLHLPTHEIRTHETRTHEIRTHETWTHEIKS